MSTGLGELSWSASATQPWLSLSPNSGSTLATVDLTANASALPIGTYFDSVHIQAGAFAQTIPVTLSVTSSTPVSPIYLPLIRR
jgi:hypothetical protein